MSPTMRPVAGATGEGLVAALTFDDGPHPVGTPGMLDVLARHGVRATFCVVGQQVSTPAGARLLRRTVAEGHRLGCHAMTFADMGSWPAARVREDLRACLASIDDALGLGGAAVPWFRAPNGSWGVTAAVAVELGLQPLAVVNTIDDWRTQDVATLVRNLEEATRPGELVLAHDGGGDRRGTVEAVDRLLERRLAEGWSFTWPAPPGHPDQHPDRPRG